MCLMRSSVSCFYLSDAHYVLYTRTQNAYCTNFATQYLFNYSLCFMRLSAIYKQSCTLFTCFWLCNFTSLVNVMLLYLSWIEWIIVYYSNHVSDFGILGSSYPGNMRVCQTRNILPFFVNVMLLCLSCFEWIIACYSNHVGYGWIHTSNSIMIPPTPFSFQYCRASFANKIIENLLYSNVNNQEHGGPNNAHCCKQNLSCILSTSCRPVTFVRRGGARVFAGGGGGGKMPCFCCASADKSSWAGGGGGDTDTFFF